MSNNHGSRNFLKLQDVDFYIPPSHALRLAKILADYQDYHFDMSPDDYDFCWSYSQLLHYYVAHHRALSHLSPRERLDFEEDMHLLQQSAGAS